MRETTTRETIDTMRTAAIVLALTTTGCSIGMKPVQPGWDGTEEPECTDDEGLVYADAIAGGLMLGVGAGAADASSNARDRGDSSTGADAVAITALAGSLVFLVSALVGEGKYKACHEAYAQWRIGGAIGRASRENTSDEAERKRLKKQIDADADLREFFCARSDDGGFCTRSEETCRSRRGEGFTECANTETVWCAEEDRCFPVQRLCANYAGSAGISRGCKERHGAKRADATTPASPRGFYCSSSATAGFCAREKADCAKTRDMALGAAPDLSECTLTEKAWCMGDTCMPTQEFCSARAEKAGSGASCEQRE